jgi:hypothetical protein
VKDQNWFAVALDFFIVVAGILIAFQITNWNEGRRNQDLAAGYIERLQTDIGTELQLWEKASDYFNTARDYGRVAVAGFDTPIEDLDEQFLIAAYQASQVWFVAPSQATWGELQSTGRIVNLRDDQLKTSLTNHYVRVRQTGVTLSNESGYRRTVRLYLHQNVQDQIRKKCGDRWTTDANNFYFVHLPPTCELDLPEQLVRDEIAALHTNEEIKRELRFHMSVLDAQIGVINNTSDIATTTLEKLNEATP